MLVGRGGERRWVFEIVDRTLAGAAARSGGAANLATSA
jgi:hypothetical protein